MGKATHQQTNFLGGEWTESARGRADDPRYKTALGLCRNAYPTKQGAYQRRSGTQAIIPTCNRNYAKLLSLETASSLPYMMEFTDNALRFFFGASPCFTNDFQYVTVATAGSGELDITTGAAHGWSVGDDVMFWFPQDYPFANEGSFRNRVCQIVTAPTGTTLHLGDETGAFTLSGGITTDGTVRVYRIAKTTTTISGQNVLRTLRSIPTDDSSVIVQASIQPRQVKVTTAASADQDPAFALSTVSFIDGPYGALKGVGGSVSSLTGSTTFTPTSGAAFVASDVGRHIRLFSEPVAWAIGTTYAYGDLVKYNNQYWQSTSAANVGHYPGSPLSSGGSTTTYWVPAPSAARWVWGTISSQTGTACVVALTDASATGGANGTIPALNGVNSITDYQLGLYNSTDGYPVCGVFHEGRLFLSGPAGNRFDGSMSNAVFQFSVTDQFGTVNDNNAISYTLNSADNIQWMKADDRGIIAGALHGEWLITSSTGDDTITPTSVKARKVTDYGCAAVEPQRVGGSLIFAQRYKRELYEYLIDSFSARFGGKPINELAPHFTESGIAEIAYTAEPVPTIWVRMADRSLAAVTYRRVSRFITELPIYEAWHGHAIGDTRLVESLCSSSGPGGGDQGCASLVDSNTVLEDTAATNDLLYLVTTDGTFDRMIEIMQPPKRDEDDFAAGWFVDDAPGPGKHVVGLSTDFSTPACVPFGGLRGADGYTINGTEPADIGHRSTLSSTIPPVGNTGRADALALAMDDAVFFNQYSMLSRLPQMRDTRRFTLSVWLNYTNPCVLGGNILVSPFQNKLTDTAVIIVPDGPTAFEAFDISATKTATRSIKLTISADLNKTDGTTAGLAPGTYYCQLRAVPVKKKPVNVNYQWWHGGLITPCVSFPSAPGAGDGRVFGAIGDTGSNIAAGHSSLFTQNGLTGDPSIYLPAVQDPANIGSFQNGWFHLMFSCNLTSVVVTDNGHTGGPASWHNYTIAVQGKITAFINDTEIVNITGAPFSSSGDRDKTLLISATGDEPTAIGSASKYLWGSVRDWVIGGRSPGVEQNTAPFDGTGINCGMSELWFDNDQFVDWTNSANRAAFHKADLAQLTWAPADLGARGQTPTGTKPLLYCTGGPQYFHLNRAKKNAPLAVYNNYPDVKHETRNALDKEIFLDSWFEQSAPLGGFIGR